mgnify:CR=1 FL=1
MCLVGIPFIVKVQKTRQRGVVVRILLADNESNVRYGLHVLLEEHPEFQVVGEVVHADDLHVGTRRDDLEPEVGLATTSVPS